MSRFLDGVDDFVTVPDHANWDFGTGLFTIALWFKPRVFGAGSAYSFITRNGLNDFALRKGTDGTLQLYTEGSERNFGAWSPALNTWHFLVVLRAAAGGGSDPFRAYINFVKQATEPTGGPTIDGTDNVIIGKLSTGGEQLDGLLSHIHIYKGVALRPDQHIQIARRPGSIREGLVLYLPFIQDVNDYSGFKLNGVSSGDVANFLEPPVTRNFSNRRRDNAYIVGVPAANNFLVETSDTITVTESSVRETTKTDIQLISYFEDVAKYTQKDTSDSITVTESDYHELTKMFSDNITVTPDPVVTEFTKQITDSILYADNAEAFLAGAFFSVLNSDTVTYSEGVTFDILKVITQTIDTTAFVSLSIEGQLQFLASANASFLNLQSGNARPFFYIEGILSGVTSIFGKSYSTDNWLIDGGVIDREKPATPKDRSNIFSSDVTLKLDNSTRRFSPLATSSVFYNLDYLDSLVNYWAGFMDVSGTALLLQRGAFFLENLKIDGRQNIAYLRLRDKFRKPLERTIGGVDVSGTALQLILTGSYSGRAVIESLLLTGAGLTAADVDIQNAQSSFFNISFSQQPVANAVSQIAEGSDGFIYTDRRGILKFRTLEPTFTGLQAVVLNMTESNYAQNIFYEQDKNDRLSTVIVNFQSGVDANYQSQSTNISASTLIITNDSIQTTADAIAIGSRIRDRFSGQITKLEIPAVWLPSLDLGDRVTIVSDNLSISGQIFEIYKIQEEPTNNTMRLFLVSERGVRDNEDDKFGFFSDPSAVDCGTIFTGGPTGETGGWQAGFAFFSRETTTAVNPGFDAEGNNDNDIDTGYAASGAGSTGIEVPFVFY